MRRIGAALTASQRTSLLAAVLAVGAALFVVFAGVLRLHQPVDAKASPFEIVALTAMFAVAELALLHIEFRREAYSFSLSGVPIALGALTVSPLLLVLTRLVGTAIAFAWQRPGREKATYNLFSYAFEAGLVGFATSALVGDGVGLTLGAGAAVLGVMLATDFLMSDLVLRVISWHSERPGRSERIRVYLSGSIVTILASLLAVTALIVASRGWLGAAVLLGLLVVFIVVHRAYAALHSRHASLEMIHQFVIREDIALSFEDLVGDSLRRICTSLRASRVALLFNGWEGRSDLVVVDEFGEVSWREVAPEALEEPLYQALLAAGQPTILARNTIAPDLREYLNARELRDAMLVPVLDSDGVLGTMQVSDRQGETATFGPDDAQVAQTLAAHMAVALRSASLLERLRHDANHDALTGIGNRSLLQVALDRVHIEPHPHGEFAALLLLDLDRFKEVNDVLGHVAGDRLLCVVAERLTALAAQNSPAGTVVRLGGDEFAILLTDIDDPVTAESFAQTVIAALMRPIMVNGIALNAEASLGLTVYRPGEVEPGELLRQADLAMYGVKGTGRTVGLYTKDLERGHAERLALVADLRLGLDRDELAMLYQPKLDLASGAIVGVEALIRWYHPKFGMLSPDTFIPLAESTGLIDQITEIALRLSLRQCGIWRAAGFDLSVAVNLSAHNLLDSSLPNKIRATLAEFGLPAEALTLEITEGSVVSEPELTIPIIHELADIGCCISLDDFGTGYSSLSYLQNLPVTEVKIDRSFITDFVGDCRRESLVAAIIGLGESLQLRVVAEGIEDASTENHLRRMGCDIVQGYFIGAPSRPDRLEELLVLQGARLPGAAPSSLSAPASLLVRQREIGTFRH
jgi:diguanylate cyclase (GGDEF)-like protein